jgi:hypothetical protein
MRPKIDVIERESEENLKFGRKENKAFICFASLINGSELSPAHQTTLIVTYYLIYIVPVQTLGYHFI